MNARPKSIQELVDPLPLDMRAEVVGFIEFLIAKRRPQEPKTLRQDWAGALREYRAQYTSLELQQQALAWRGG